jgi:hypothetical protein
MKKFFTLFLVIAIYSYSLYSQNANFGWYLAGGGSTGADRSADVVTDSSGNIYAVNYFLYSSTFNGVTHTGSAKGTGANYDNSLFVSKISPSKTTLWSIYSNVGVVTPVAAATTPAGDFILTGTIRSVVGGSTTSANIIDADGTETTFTGLNSSSSYLHSFVAKFNSSGKIQWAKVLAPESSKDSVVSTSAITSDANGNVYITGYFLKNLVLPSSSSTISLTSTNSTQAAFIAKLNGSTGETKWYKVTSGAIVSEVFPAIAYNNGYIYAAGDVKNATTPVSVSIDDVSYTPSVGADITLVKLDTTGNVSYIKERASGSTSKDIRVKDVLVNSGNVYISGSFYGGAGIVFTNSTLTTTTSGYLNSFIAAFNSSDGSDLWQKTVAAPAIAEVLGLAVGANNYLYAFGYHYNALGTTVAAGDVSFGNGFTLTDATNKLGDLFLSSYLLSTGETKEAHRVGAGTGSETANALTAYESNLYLIGSSNSAPLTFENASTYSTLGAFDFFLVNYTVSTSTSVSNASDKSTKNTVYYDDVNQKLVFTDAEDVASLQIFDATGKLLVASYNNTNIETSYFSTGVYILKFSSKNGIVSTLKFVVK